MFGFIFYLNVFLQGFLLSLDLNYGSFRIIKRMGVNAYKIELPGYTNIFTTFNVSDLPPYYSNEDPLDIENKSSPTHGA